MAESKSKHEIPAAMLSAAVLAVHSLGYLNEWASEKAAQAALEAAGVPALIAERDRFEKNLVEIMSGGLCEEHLAYVRSVRFWEFKTWDDSLGCKACHKAEADGIRGHIQKQAARIAKLEADTHRLRWLMDNSGIDGFSQVKNDRYDFAFDCADEADRSEPNEGDEFDGWRRLIDAAMNIEEGEL